MRFQLDDEVTTKDGRKHRVLWGTKTVNGEQVVLLVKRLDDPKKGEKHKVKVESVKQHTRKGELVYHITGKRPTAVIVDEVSC